MTGARFLLKRELGGEGTVTVILNFWRKGFWFTMYGLIENEMMGMRKYGTKEEIDVSWS